MRFIAHRVFGDHQPIQPIESVRSLPLHGVELDVRLSTSGEPVIDHAPVFMLRSHRRAQIPKSFHAAIHFLSTRLPTLEYVLLDIKSGEAASAVGLYLAGRDDLPFEVIFNCWHADDVLALKAALPDAFVLFCLAPVFTRRIPRGRFRDLYLFNSFPFVHSRQGFRPKEDKPNRHNINVKLISRETLNAYLPRAIDGLCVHRVFCAPELVAFAQSRGLKVAVYGLRYEKPAMLDRVRPFADFAMVRGTRRARPKAPSNSLDSVT